MSWVWDISVGNAELKRCIDDYYVKGMGVMMSYIKPDADFGRGEVMVKSIDPLSVYFDPDAEDPFCRDASNIVVAKRMTEKELIEMKKGSDFLIFLDFNCSPVKNYQHLIYSHQPVSSDFNFCPIAVKTKLNNKNRLHHTAYHPLITFLFIHANNSS